MAIPIDSPDVQAARANVGHHQRYGLEWEYVHYNLEPKWTVEPSVAAMETLIRRRLALSDLDKCTISYHDEGTFNKLYKIETDALTLMLRLALPVDPYRKTASEVATMEFARRRMGSAIPRVFAHDASNDNDLRFEWILMEFKPGRPLEDMWRMLSMPSKESLAKQLAQNLSKLYDDKFRSIGNIHLDIEEDSYCLGSLVALTFIRGDKALPNNRGPFRNSHAWLSARLDLVLEDQEQKLGATDDEDEIEDAEKSIILAKQLMAILPTVFPPDEEETTMLLHDDVHERNILVDEHGSLTALLDWECVSVVPTWMACQPPAFLNGRTRKDEPRKEIYAHFNPDVDEGTAEENENVSPLYWEHLLDFERGHLLQIFLSEMEQIQPKWNRDYKAGELKRDLALAVLQVDMDTSLKCIEMWLAAYGTEEQFSLRELFVR